MNKKYRAVIALASMVVVLLMFGYFFFGVLRSPEVAERPVFMFLDSIFIPFVAVCGTPSLFAYLFTSTALLPDGD